MENRKIVTNYLRKLLKEKKLIAGVMINGNIGIVFHL